MKKGLLALSLIIIIIGLAIATWAAGFHRKVVLSLETLDDALRGWRVSGSFNAGNRLDVTISPNPDEWFAEPKTDEYQFPNFEIDVSITDPKGGKTNFTAVYAQVPQGALQFFVAKLVSNDGGLIIEEENIKVKTNTTIYCNAISGITTYNGTYKAVGSFWMPPPQHMRLFKHEIAVEWPYLYVAPIGVVLIGPGAVLFIEATKKPKHRAKLKNNKNR